MVCVKFPAASVDESYLRKLTEPFGKIVKILMFSSLVSVRRGLGRGGCRQLSLCSTRRRLWSSVLWNRPRIW